MVPMDWWDTDSWNAVRLSIRVSLVATSLCLLLGTPLAIWLARTRSRLRSVVEVVTLSPLVIPPVVIGLLLLWVVRWLNPGLLFTSWAAALASGIVAFPLLVRTVRVTIEGIDPRLSLVAATL